MTEQNISDPQQSLQIITEAIQGSKENIKENAWYFIFWGILVSVTCLIHYTLLKMHYDAKPHILWPALMIGGGIISSVHGYREEKKKPYQSHLSLFMKNLWIVLGLAYIIVIVMCFKYQNNPVMPILLLSGIGTLVTGLTIKFKAMSIGGVALLVCSVLALWTYGVESLVLCAVAIIVGFVIPGVLLKKST